MVVRNGGYATWNLLVGTHIEVEGAPEGLDGEKPKSNSVYSSHPL